MAARESKTARIARARRLADILARLYPEARVSLDFETPWQLLVATILSAQCTDERVNIVTPALFRRYPDPQATAAADVRDLERLVVTTGFFRQKARSLKAAAQQILERYRGDVPAAMDELVKLPGVGRKTANVVLGHAFGIPGMAVDTHVRRVSYRLGLTRESDPEKIEADLCDLLPSEQWTAFSMRLILHGRRVCAARKPRCAECALLADCPRTGVSASFSERTVN